MNASRFVLLHAVILSQLMIAETSAQFEEPKLTEIGTGNRIEWSPVISADGLEAYFTSFVSNGNWDIWSARRETRHSEWEVLGPLEIVNSLDREDSPTLTVDGLTLIFSSSGRDNDLGIWQLWETTRANQNSPWREPVKLGREINRVGNRESATISEDGLTLIFGEGTLGVGELNMSRRDSVNDPWSKPVALSERNGHQIGVGGNPSLHPDGLSLYFDSRSANRDLDVFVSRRPRLDAPFGPPESLGSTINTPNDDVAPFVASDNSLYYSREAGEPTWEIWRAEAEPLPRALQPGDSDQDLDFDQLDLVQVQRAGKYLTSQAATWGDGDWDGAPGGEQGSPPIGDRMFNQWDIGVALNAAVYLTGRYAALAGPGIKADGQTSLVYDVATGELSIDASAGSELTSINVSSASGMFIGNKPVTLDGAFDNFAADNVFKATFGGSFGSVSFGNVLPAGLSEDAVTSDLSAIGSLAVGGDLRDVDLVYVPEPTATILVLCGVLGLGLIRRLV